VDLVEAGTSMLLIQLLLQIMMVGKEGGKSQYSLQLFGSRGDNDTISVLMNPVRGDIPRMVEEKQETSSNL